MKRNPHIGSSLDDFLKEEGILEETLGQTEESIRLGINDSANVRIRLEREVFEECEDNDGIDGGKG